MLACGFDEGCVVVELGSDDPVASMDSTGKIVCLRIMKFKLPMYVDSPLVVEMRKDCQMERDLLLSHVIWDLVNCIRKC